VQPFPSLHAVPSGFGGFEQTPLNGLHTPALWHPSAAGHTTGFPPPHTPAWHTSVCVQAFPSLQAVPVSAVHAPSAAAPAATEHASQLPALHATLQHTPSAQNPVRHWAAVEQMVPCARSPPQKPEMQFPRAQVAFDVHAVPAGSSESSSDAPTELLAASLPPIASVLPF